MRLLSEQLISNKPWEPAALVDALCKFTPKASQKSSWRIKTPRKLLQEVAKQELLQGMFQHKEYQPPYCADEPHDLDSPSTSMLFSPDGDSLDD